ncbi:MAG: hypothetical protein V1873_05710 [Verrucomicrobiota bacterium]
MKRVGILLAVVAFVGVATVVLAGKMVNASFETDFGSREELNMWGEHGDVWGEAYQVLAGKDKPITKARTGTRVLLINVPPDTWNGAWQQVSWPANAPFVVQAYYLIQGGDLPPDCATFMKAEFYDGSDGMISYIEGERRREQTSGQWVRDTLKGTTPDGTASIRIILIAGSNKGGTNLVNRIYWDDCDTLE